MTALLATEALSVSIAGKNVCEQLAFSVNRGERWGILGVNGVGKTTLLHTLGGLRSPNQGSITYRGENITAIPAPRLAQQRGFLFQDFNDPFPSTVMETVLIGRHPHIKSWQWESADDVDIANAALAEVGLSDLAHRVVSTLSGGERRRLALASLLAQQPALFFLDEPTNHLDLQYQIQMMQLLTERARREDAALIMILHDINLASRFCDHVLMLFGEGKTAAGATETLFTESTLSELYRYPVQRVDSQQQRLFIPKIR